MNKIKALAFLLFVLSGFCGLLYQVVWFRLAFRSFGIITPVFSVVVSVFMLGLALGSWAGGRWIEKDAYTRRVPPALYYACVELLIGVGAFVVPKLYRYSETYLLSSGEMSSLNYLTASALLITASILPWCFLMGCTFPFMMAQMRGTGDSSETNFSFLYLANVIGAMCGALLTAFVLIEAMGFSRTLLVGGLTNFTIAGLALVLMRLKPFIWRSSDERPAAPADWPERGPGEKRWMLALVLFTTGFVTMALEVIWIRAFTTVLLTTVYAFAYLITVYLLSTWAGSWLYRRHAARGNVIPNAVMYALITLFAFVPALANDPRIHMSRGVILLSIAPLCAGLGYLTPRMVDRYSLGSPRGAGVAYAINIAGCILGPLVATYALLPLMGARQAMVLTSLLFAVIFILGLKEFGQKMAFKAAVLTLTAIFSVVGIFVSRAHDETYEGIVRRDYTATVTTVGTGMKQGLLVNGYGITKKTPITKMMAHWPLMLLGREPKSALAICFGMGTTYRSLMSWPISVTAVELVPSVKAAFGDFHADADEILKDPRGRIVIDDGRRFLSRTREKYDVITVDPPPPVEASGSGFLYSRDFYEIAKARLTEGGIMHQWLPYWDEKTRETVITALRASFRHVIVSASVEGKGMHFLASMTPIAEPDLSALAARIPETAKADMVEWSADKRVEPLLLAMLRTTNDAGLVLNAPIEGADMITDDRPFNEYYILRRYFGYSG
jgi:predicted membrane-bound spermidine synthase